MAIEVLRAAQRVTCLAAWLCVASTGQTQVLEPLEPEVDKRGAGGLSSYTYKIEPALLLTAPEAVGARATQEQVRAFLERNGIVLRSEEGEAFFYNDRIGELRIRAEARMVALLEKALEAARSKIPVVEIRTEMMEFAEGTLGQDLEALLSSGKDFKLGEGVLTILTEAEGSAALKQLELMPGVDLLTLPAVKTVSGRMARLRVEDEEPVFIPPFHAPRGSSRRGE